MTATIFLHDAATLRVSFLYSVAAVAAIKAIGDARWDPASRTWRVPLERLDAVLSIFGGDCGLAPEVVLAAKAEVQEVIAPPKPATPEQRLEFFMRTLAWAGVTLRIEGARVIGEGGCWTPVLQAEIDKRAVPLRRLIASGWQAPQTVAPLPAPVPADLSLITHMDRVMAAGEANARKAAERKEGYKEAAKRARFAAMRQESLLEEVQS